MKRVAIFENTDGHWAAHIAQRPGLAAEGRTLSEARDALFRKLLAAGEFPPRDARADSPNPFDREEIVTPFGCISRSDAVFHGQACIADTRIPVFQVVRMMANGETVESLLEAYPNLHRNDVQACLDYASLVVEDQSPSSDLEEEEEREAALRKAV